jgi:hypothetical protein
VFPRLLAIIADMKEKWELLCLYANGSVNRPCPAYTDTKEFSRQKIEKILEGRKCVDSWSVLLLNCVSSSVARLDMPCITNLFFLPKYADIGQEKAK